MMTVRRLRASRRISSFSAVRLKPPRPGRPAGAEVGRNCCVGAHQSAPVLVALACVSSPVSAMNASSMPRAVISRSFACVAGQQVPGGLDRCPWSGPARCHRGPRRVGAWDVAQHGLARARQRGPHGPASGHGLDLGGSAVGDDLAVPQQHDPVRVGVRFLQVVRREQHCPALLGVLPDGRPEVAPALDVHPGGRLVEHQQLGIGQQRHGEPQPLLLAA